MIRALHLSTVGGKEANALALKSFTKSLVTANTEAASSSVACVDVFLHVHDAHRGTFLDHAQALYSAVLQIAAPAINVDVIPTVNDGSASSARQGASSESVSLFDKTSMQSGAAQEGFSPLYRYVAVGGTFDHLHAGHKLLLSAAVLHTTDRLRVGVTGAALLTNKKFAEAMQPIEVRKANALAFLSKIRKDVDIDFDTIHEISGGTDRIADIEALTLSPETSGALGTINDMRHNNGLKPLSPIYIPYVQTADGTVMSSTQLRESLTSRKH